MPDDLDQLEDSVREFRSSADFEFVDPKRLAALIDGLQGDLCKVLNRARERGEHRLARLSPTSWAARTCGMSRSSASDRLCVGKHLDSMPETSAALGSGEIGYQAAAAICHLRDQLGDRWEPANEAEMVDNARRFSVENLRLCCRHARHVADPDGFDRDCEEDFERRWLQVDPMLDGMHSVDGVLDPVTGAAFRTALDALALWPGCDRPVGWPIPHHIESWSRSCATVLGNRVVLCQFDHRMVHEGEWQLVKVGDEVHVMPPYRLDKDYARGQDVRWAA